VELSGSGEAGLGGADGERGGRGRRGGRRVGVVRGGDRSCGFGTLQGCRVGGRCRLGSRRGRSGGAGWVVRDLRRCGGSADGAGERRRARGQAGREPERVEEFLRGDVRPARGQDPRHA